MSKFKIGDRVVLHDSSRYAYYDPKVMSHALDEVLIVTSIQSSGRNAIVYAKLSDGNEFPWHPDDLELL